MAHPCSILVFGLDAHLLQTRCMVLQSAGFQVFAQSDLFALDPALLPMHFDLLVFCHTVQADDALLVAAFGRSFWPAAGVIRMTPGWRSHPLELLRTLTRACEPAIPPVCADFPFGDFPVRPSGADFYEN